MNIALNVGLGTIAPKTLYGVLGGIAVGSALAVFTLVAVYQPYLGDVVQRCLWPFFLAVAIWLIAGVSRLRIVGFLPSQADHLIPARLRPWIRFWLLARFGLFGSWSLMIVVIIGAAIVGGSLQHLVEVFVYLVWLRVFLDLCFGSVFNIGIIIGRNNTP